jgi:hypothetical protein
MSSIIFTDSFRKNLKKFRKNFNEHHISENIREFIRLGYRKGESKLATKNFGDVNIDIVKLRLRCRHSEARCLVGIINKTDYIPIFIDLKTGYYGKNLSFGANKKVVAMIENAFEKTLTDYLEHTEEQPKLTEYRVE